MSAPHYTSTRSIKESSINGSIKGKYMTHMATLTARFVLKTTNLTPGWWIKTRKAPASKTAREIAKEGPDLQAQA
jgi:hypothetical protein